MIEGQRRDEYSTQSYATAPPPSSSPPTSASPFAFAPPPLSSIPGPGSYRPTQQQQQQQQPQQHQQPPPPPPNHQQSSTMTMPQQPDPASFPPAPAADYSAYYRAQQGAPGGSATPAAAGASYPAYAGSHPLGYRTVSGATDTTRAPPPPPLRNVPTYGAMQANLGSQPSPTATSPYGYPMRSPAYASSQPSPRGGGSLAYQQGYYGSYGQPQAVDMPRSLSYPNAYSTNPYSNYLPSISNPTLVSPDALPGLHRHGSNPSITTMGQGPAVGFAFASRVPLTDRPFKCDQCVQSFNRNHDLKRHKRIHLAVKPFNCDKCGKTFSRKDALRRHWMVRGCRGEDGATAPITPTFNPNGPPPPELSPPPENGSNSSTTPSNVSGASNGPKLAYGANTMSFNHPSAPPPLSSLPARAPSDQPSHILLTPNDMGKDTGKMSLDSASIDRNPETPSTGYFEAGRKDVMGIPDSTTSSTFSARYVNSPKDDMRHHPYRRGVLPSPSALSAPPMDNKPMYDKGPFFQMGYSGGAHNLLAPNEDDVANKDTSSNGSPENTWGARGY